MAIRIAREKLARVFFQRCFYLFVVLLVFIAALPFLPPTPTGRLVVGGINVFLVVATVAAVGRSILSFAIALVFATPAVLFQYLGVTADQADPLALAWVFSAVLYATAVTYLLRYVFLPEVMTSDKLYGAASAYLMLGVLWAYIYSLVDYFYPRSFTVGGVPASLPPIDALYFSFTVLTSTGFGDIVPLSPQARAMCVIEQLAGALFVAILIARLAGVYMPKVREGS